MKVKFLLAILCVLGLALFLTSCAKAPQEEVDQANQALQAAREAEADKYAAEQFNAAQDSLDAATAEIESQNSKMAFTRNYDEAKRLLASATSNAQAAADASGSNKNQARVEAEELIAQAQATVAEAKGLITKAPKGKEGKAALEQIQADLSSVETLITEASDALNAGDFFTAREKARTASDRANALSQELKDAIAKKQQLSAR